MLHQTKNAYHQRMLAVLLYIQDNLNNTEGALNVEELAKIACFSPSHFHRVFKGMLGESLKEHVRRLRLERAAFRLGYYEDSITSLSLDAGYETLEAFSRAFRKMFEQSPSEYRRNAKKLQFPNISSGVHYQRNEPAAPPLTLNIRRSTVDVKIETLEPMRVLFVRHVGPYMEVGKAWETLCTFAMQKNLFTAPNTQILGISYDDPSVTAPEKLRYDACLTLAKDADIQPEGAIGIQTIEGGKYATVRHIGSYSNLESTYADFCGKGLPQLNLEIADKPPLEFYRNSPEETPEDELITDIYMPLK